jgi:RNA polymerase primary sigma factor
VLETLEHIAARLRQAVDHAGTADVGDLSQPNALTTAEEAAYQKLRSEIVLLVNELHLNNNRIEALIDQLYGINKRIMSINSAW